MSRFTSILKLLPLFAFLPMLESAETEEIQKTTVSNFPSFTGKVTKGKVRMRTTSSLDSQIVRELNKGEMLLVLDESEEFYAVQPPSDVKGYMFRTFVLDNKVEGNRVNIRLFPNMDAPVIAQMNSGEQVIGTISPLNNKWLEIAPPSGTKFYVAKEYVEKVGDKNFMAQVAKRKEKVNYLLESNYSLTQQEFQKSFPDIPIDRLVANYKMIVQNYPDFPDQAARANELLEELQDNYLHKKVAFLETKIENQKYVEASKKQASPHNTSTIATIEPMGFPAVLAPSEDPNLRMTAWIPLENERYEEWSKTHEGAKEDFYTDESKNSVALKGVIAPYIRAVKNKPGDFVILKKDTQLPQAFLYSTKVNLNEYVGKEVTIQASPRPNNHFAYPAYFVLSIQ
jgi:hypothetical protein